MKLFILGVALLFVSVAARAQYDHFEFHSPFGSDGSNQPGLSVEERSETVYRELWNNYFHGRTLVLRDLPRLKAKIMEKSGPYSFQTLACAFYGSMLERMAELRAFSQQNPNLVIGNERDELKKIDSALRVLDLRYVAEAGDDPATGRSRSSGQMMVDYCSKVGLDKVASALRPLLSKTGVLLP